MNLNGVRTVSLLFFLTFLSLGTLSAQEGNNENISSETFEQKQEALEGTFQIEMIDTRSLPTFNISLYDSIREMRDDNEIVYLNVSDLMRIKILPRTVIEDNNFQKVERVVYTFSK